MVDQSIELAVRNYLRAANVEGIRTRRAVLFGSHVRGTADRWSDIDLIVIAPELESPTDHKLVSKL